MADDVTLPANTGTFDAASDEVGGKHYQKVKIADGTADSVAMVKATNTTPGGSDVGLVVRSPSFPAALSAGGNFKVAIVEDTVGSMLATDDGDIAGGQANVALVACLHYKWNGATWKRGGSTPFRKTSAASTNLTSLKASAGVLTMLMVQNLNASVRYVTFYNKASAPVIADDSALIVQKYPIPGNTAGAGFALPLPPEGLAFSTGIAYAFVTGIADTNAGAVAADEIIMNGAYQ